MKCQQCNVNRATVNVTLQMNQERKQLHVCSDCFQQIQGQIGNAANFFRNDDMFSNPFFQGQMGGSPNSGATTKTKHANQGGGLLDDLGTNVTDQARVGKIDPVIGRDEEIKRTIETLNRRNKNNPVLIGEPGVGKTAMAEGLALKIIEGDVPAKLMNKEVYVLDVASLVANTGVRG